MLSEEKYQSPEVKTIRIQVNAVLCGSDGNSTEGFSVSGNNYEEDSWD